MFKISNIKIIHKLTFLSICVFVALVLTSTVAIVKLHHSSNYTIKLADADQGLIGMVDNGRHLQALFKELRISAIKYPMTVSKDERNAQKIAFHKNKATFTDVLNQVKRRCSIVTSKECDRIVQNMFASLEEYERATFGEVIRLTEDGYNHDAYLAIQKFLVPIGNDIDKGVNSLIEIARNDTSSVLEEMKGITSYTAFMILAILGTLLAVLLTYLIGISIVVPINRLARSAKKVADGDLTVKIDTSAKDEIGNLSVAFESMVEHLRKIIESITNDTKEMIERSHQMIDFSNSVSGSSEQILGQSITIASASEEMASTSKDIAKNCAEAQDYSYKVEEIVKEGVALVEQTVLKIRDHSVQTKQSAEMIDELGEKTNNISGIISTIQDIAEQTNLLALNAAIEAARAGEYGRGFAVVADEVRSLASRTAESTQEISEMISAIQEQVKQATTTMKINVDKMNEIADGTTSIEESLGKINQSVDTVHQQIMQIASATEEQTATSQEMSANMQVISDATSQTVEMMRSSVTMSQDIEKISTSMQDNVEIFKL